MKILLFFFTLATAQASLASEGSVSNEQDFANYTVRYSVFNSTFVAPEIAKIHGIKRSAYESLINVSVSPRGEFGAYPAKISGTVKNLLQQQVPLEFIEISEQDATYYIAPLRISGEETVHIHLNVTPNDSTDELELNFTKKLFSDK